MQKNRLWFIHILELSEIKTIWIVITIYQKLIIILASSLEPSQFESNDSWRGQILLVCNGVNRNSIAQIFWRVEMNSQSKRCQSSWKRKHSCNNTEKKLISRQELTANCWLNGCFYGCHAQKSATNLCYGNGLSCSGSNCSCSRTRNLQNNKIELCSAYKCQQIW